MHSFKPPLFFVSLVLLPVFYSGCTVGPNYTPPQIDVPDQWHQELTDGFKPDGQAPAQWWQLLNDPNLVDLIQQARQNNPDLQNAYWNLVSARYARDYVTGDYYPSVDVVGSYTRQLNSKNGFFGSRGSTSNSYDLYSVGFDASWEFNVFGRFKRAWESAQASYEAQIENYRDVMVSLAAEVAANYVDLRMTQARIQYTMDNIESQKGMLKLAQARFQSEIAPRLDVEQATLNLADTQSQLPPLRSAEKAAVNRLCILIGENPGRLGDLLTDSKPIPAPPREITVQMPAELLRQRPDIRRAERQLAAQTAQIGYVTADLYPSFSLNGDIGFQAMDFSNLAKSGSKNYNFGPSFRWNIFDGNRVRDQIKIEESKTNQLYWQYRSTVLSALEEVENAMTDYVQQSQRTADLQRSVTAAKASVQLVSTQYKNGLTDFQSVLVLQRSQFQQEDKLAQSQGQVVLDMVRVYKALGGWEEPMPSPASGQPFGKKSDDTSVRESE